MTYLEHIAVYFISLVGKGVALSSSDLALVRQWEAQGLPPEAVCRALAVSVGQRRAQGRVSLSDCASTVSRLVVSQTATANDDSGSPRVSWTPSLLLHELERVGRDASDPQVKQVYRALFRHVRSLPPESELTVQEVNQLDAMAVSLLMAELPQDRRREIEKAAALRSFQLLGPWASALSHRRLIASLTEDALREQFEWSLPGEILLAKEPA